MLMSRSTACWRGGQQVLPTLKYLDRSPHSLMDSDIGIYDFIFYASVCISSQPVILQSRVFFSGKTSLHCMSTRIKFQMCITILCKKQTHHYYHYNQGLFSQYPSKPNVYPEETIAPLNSRYQCLSLMHVCNNEDTKKFCIFYAQNGFDSVLSLIKAWFGCGFQLQKGSNLRKGLCNVCRHRAVPKYGRHHIGVIATGKSMSPP